MVVLLKVDTPVTRIGLRRFSWAFVLRIFVKFETGFAKLVAVRIHSDFTITMASAIRAAAAGFYMGRDECPVTIPKPLAQNFFLSHNHSSPILRNFQQFLPDIAMAAAPPSVVNPISHFLQFSSPKSARDRIRQIASTRRGLVLEATASPTLRSNLSEILIASSSYPISAMSRSTKSHRRPNDITLISLKQKLFLDIFPSTFDQSTNMHLRELHRRQRPPHLPLPIHLQDPMPQPHS
jgi:hypothetical protein